MKIKAKKKKKRINKIYTYYYNYSILNGFIIVELMLFI